jgi:hypothetical protein
MPLAVVLLLIQIAFAMHVVKSGRDVTAKFWVR